MPLRQDLEQQLSAFLGEGDVTQFVQDQEPVPGIALDQPTQGVSLARLQEFVGQAATGDSPLGRIVYILSTRATIPNKSGHRIETVAKGYLPFPGFSGLKQG